MKSYVPLRIELLALGLMVGMLYAFSACAVKRRDPNAPISTDAIPVQLGIPEANRPTEADAAASHRFRMRAGPEGVIPAGALLRAMEHAERMPMLQVGSSPGVRSGGLWDWDWLGPINIGGRVRSILIDPENPAKMWVGGVQGGIWKTTNGGSSWSPVNDFLASIAVSCMAMDPQDPDIMYAGTGESFAFDGVPGYGIFKSTDGGNTWLPLSDTRPTNPTNDPWNYVNRIAIDPTYSNIVLAATGCRPSGTTGCRSTPTGGIYRSDDGGDTGSWTRVWTETPPQFEDTCHSATVFKGPGVADLRFRHSGRPIAGTFDGRVLYSEDFGQTWSPAGYANDCLAYTHLDQDFSPDGDCNDDRLDIVSGDGFVTGDSITITGTTTTTVRVREVYELYMIVDDLPNSLSAGDEVCSGPSNRVELGVTAADPFMVYASIDVGGGAIWRSTFPELHDFELRGWTGHLEGQGGYDNCIWISPDDENLLVAGGVNLYRSLDGGVSFERISDWTDYPGDSIHADQHVIVESPNFSSTNPKVFIGNDGGIFRTDDILTVAEHSGWESLVNGLGITQFYAAAVGGGGIPIMGGTQDNGTPFWSDTGPYWDETLGGDGGYCAVDPTDPDILYAETQYLGVNKSTNGGARWHEKIDGLVESGEGNGAPFLAPLVMDPCDPDILIAGATFLWQTVDGAEVWIPIKSQLTNTPTCTALAMDPACNGVIWAGYSNGSLSTSTLGPFWTDNVDDNGPNPIPENAITDIAISPDNSDEVWVTIGGYVSNSVWYTDNAGITWHQRTGSGTTSLPPANVNTITLHPQNSNWIYVGTDLGIYVSQDKGLTWNTTPRYHNQNPFPHDGPVNVEVADLIWEKDEYLIAATHGRGMFRTRVLPIVYVDWRNEGGLELGIEDYPYGTVHEGYNAAGNGSTLSIAGGEYSEIRPLVMEKQLNIVTTGGPVVIR